MIRRSGRTVDMLALEIVALPSLGRIVRVAILCGLDERVPACLPGHCLLLKFRVAAQFPHFGLDFVDCGVRDRHNHAERLSRRE